MDHEHASTAIESQNRDAISACPLCALVPTNNSMTGIGYHASHEQFTPSELLEYVTLAETHGVDHVLASDHFHPWSERQGESGFVWSWLGAALQATDSVTFGTVNAPGYRYHPAIVAQAVGTLLELAPDRFWLAVGSGQLLNEGITGTDWPVKADRNERLREAVSVMRTLWTGEEVTHHGRIDVERATLYTKPPSPPPVIGAALSEETARWCGEWADGLITVATPDHESLADRVEAFHETAPDKPVYLKAQHAYGSDEEAALSGALDQWLVQAVPGPITQALRTPAEYDALAADLADEAIHERVRISADPSDHVAWVRDDLELGVDRVYLHNVTPHQEPFIEEVLPSILNAV